MKLYLLTLFLYLSGQTHTNILIGIWQIESASYTNFRIDDHYRFFENGEFIFNGSKKCESGLPSKLIGIKGTYSTIGDSILILTPQYTIEYANTKLVRGGGEFSEWSFDSYKKIEIPLVQVTVNKFVLKYGYDILEKTYYIKFDGRKYFHITKNPNKTF